MSFYLFTFVFCLYLNKNIRSLKVDYLTRGWSYNFFKEMEIAGVTTPGNYKGF